MEQAKGREVVQKAEDRGCAGFRGEVAQKAGLRGCAEGRQRLCSLLWNLLMAEEHIIPCKPIPISNA